MDRITIWNTLNNNKKYLPLAAQTASRPASACAPADRLANRSAQPEKEK